MGREEETYCLAALLQVAGIGRQRALALVAAVGSARKVWQADKGDLFLSKHLRAESLAALAVARGERLPERLAEQCRRAGVKVTAIGAATYPRLLAQIPDAPPALYYRGELPVDERALAIVGTRRATPYGLAVAKDMAAEFAGQGAVVISGGAAGIDGAAHAGALACGRTVAVLGCGVDVCYPPKHRQLFEQIAANGALVSEYAPGTPPAPGRFPERNRIISGLSAGVVVVEAGQRSGALITADLSLDYNREVFCVPGSVFSPVSRGTHALIKQGARLVESPAEVLAELRWPAQTAEPCAMPALSGEEQAVLAACCAEQVTTGETILTQTGFAPAKAAGLLLALEMKKLIKRSENGYWRLKGRS